MREQALLDTPDPVALRNRIGQVILVGNDYNRGLFAAALATGILDISDSITIYQSRVDKALALSKWVFGRERIGKMLGENATQSAAARASASVELFVEQCTRCRHGGAIAQPTE